MITDMQKLHKMENQTIWTVSKTLVRKLDVNVTGKEAH